MNAELRETVRAVSKSEFAKLLGVCVGTLNNWERRGVLGVRLCPVRRGRRAFYSWSIYEAWQQEVDRRRRERVRAAKAMRGALGARRAAVAALKRLGAKVPGGG